MRVDDAGIRRVVVVGAGTMGHGIAQVAAMAGTEVVLVDRTSELVDVGLDRIRANLDAGVARGKVTTADRDATLARLRGGTDAAEAARDADLAIEAIPERLDLKRALFGTLERAAPADAILASNTSSLSVSALQDGLARPDRVVGMHFFNPVHIMKLVEVVRGAATSDLVVDAAADFAQRMGKEPIVVNDSPGFASSRLGVALGLEAMRMLEEGVASAADIDTAMTLGYRHPMGPLRLTDMVGLDVRLDIAEYLHESLGSERFRPPEILRRMVAEGKLGRKSGEGFFDWGEES
ncbi:MAG TPA: 3-hydroxyacyl-CoA dehydrogenase family protein [Longimicrobiales bacterium]|nr:3-hydroxyacyl-CoA dehydrogenase family protein [Longimicrobiales bacterium]